ncbi:MAG: RNA polymerase factor sigma-54 [Steroidobacteraceae bacterium]
MLKPSLQLKLGQTLTMTPQLQQAIRLLQMPALELAAHVRELLESNVMLEALEDSETTGSFIGVSPLTERPAQERQDQAPKVEVVEDSWSTSAAGSADSAWNAEDDERQQDFAEQAATSLSEHLLGQLELARLDARTLAIATAIVDAINDDGYLIDDLAEIAATLRPEIEASEQELADTLAVVQSLDPPGVGARSVGECIALQLAQLDPQTPALEIALRIAASHLDLVAERNTAALARLLVVDEQQIADALALVRSCHPRPGAVVSGASAEYVIPDVIVRRTENGWSVEANPATLPRVRLNQGYVNLLGRNSGHAVMRSQLQEARWLLKSLEMRQDTLLKVARTIVERQSEFLEHGEEHMRPMILKDIAEAIEMHESTISRVTTSKYMHTPRGVFELKYFFSSQLEGGDGSATSSIAIRAKIRNLIREEDARNPLSDSRIAAMLAEEGIAVARRTVAKYREALGIAPSNERRRSAPN